MPSPSKTKHRVAFKVTIPSQYTTTYNANNSWIIDDESDSLKCPSEIEQSQHRSTLLDIDPAKVEKPRRNIKRIVTLNYKSDKEEKVDTAPRKILLSEGKVDVIDSLKRSSFGKVNYHRRQPLSDEELPQTNNIVSNNRYSKTIARVCSNKSRLQSVQSASSDEDDSVLDDSLDNLISSHLSTSLAVIESLECISDSLSLLSIEKKNKKAGVDIIEKEKRKQDEFFKRSAQRSQESFQLWNDKTQARLEEQVCRIKEKTNQKESSFENEFKKQQLLAQKKYEEEQVTIKRAELAAKEKAEADSARQKQLQSSWSNINTYVVTTLEIVSVAKKCVPDPTVDPEIEALISFLGKLSEDMANLRVCTSRLYEEGRLSVSIASETEGNMYAVYTKVLGGVEKLNLAIKRVNEEQVAKLAELEKMKKEQAEKDESKAKQVEIQKQDNEVKEKTVSRQSSSGPVAAPRRSRFLSSEAIVNVNIISTSAFNEYQKLDKQLRELERGLEKFATDKNTELMKMRSALKLITVTPINSISASSNEHMANKVGVLVSILEGKETVRGGKKISPGLNAVTLNYCFMISASKFVDQACEQVAFSDNLVPAFSIAAVITGIWQRHPKFGELFLANLHRTCPYTIPANWNKKQGESNSQYLVRLGYSRDGDKLEETDKFLQKMKGCIKLYAAIIQSPPAFSNMAHPHGLAHGWIWFSRVLNLEPIPDVTATVIEAFLTVAGAALHKRYKGQFLKLLDFLYTHYLPKLEGVTVESNLGPITRLKLYLESVQKKKSLPIPEGRIEVSIICR